MALRLRELGESRNTCLASRGSRFRILLPAILLLSFLSWSSADPVSALQDQQISEWKKWLVEYPPSKGAIEIELVGSFPSESGSADEAYLWKPIRMTQDREGNIYVLDYRAKKVLKFNSGGQLQKTYGIEGQGPGEFVNPRGLCAGEERIVVSDTSKVDLQFLSNGLEFIGSERVKKSYYEVCAGKNGTIYGASIIGPGGAFLIDVIDARGQLAYSFGKPIFRDRPASAILSFVRLDVMENGDVLAAYEHAPLVCRFSSKGEMIGSFELDDPLMKILARRNLESAEKRTSTYWQVIQGIRAWKNRFFILQTCPYLKITEFDAQGKKLNEFWAMQSYDYAVGDLLVRGSEPDLEFLLMQTVPETSIQVFRRK